MSAAVRFRDFGYAHPGSVRPALTDFNLHLEPGEFVLVCGGSGSGKSTLLQAIAGIVPHHYGGQATGEVEICGRDLRDHDAASLAEVCGTVLQDPESQAVMGGVEAEIAFPLENAGWKPAEIARAVEETALALGIDALLGRRTAELSGGELQRVVLAASLALGPQLVVLDEPTSQLDPVASDELTSLLLRLCRDEGATVVVADHRIERLLQHADRVIVMEQGHKAFDGLPAEMLTWAATAGDKFLLTPVARMFDFAGISPLPVGLRDARKTLAARSLALSGSRVRERREGGEAEASRIAHITAPEAESRTAPESDSPAPQPVVMRVDRVDYRYAGAPTNALDDVTLELRVGECVALMGANGSGKSSLLRVIRGVEEPSRGKVERCGEVGLLLQNPNDYLLHEHVADEVPAGQLERFGLAGMEQRNPHDLSGGERQRLALAIVMQEQPEVLLLDEPSRGMDRARREELLGELREIARTGTAVVLATHDAELAAEFAERVVLLGRGRVLADAPVGDVLASGPYFGTDVARLMPGSGALTARQGAHLLRGSKLAHKDASGRTEVLA